MIENILKVFDCSGILIIDKVSEKKSFSTKGGAHNG